MAYLNILDHDTVLWSGASHVTVWQEQFLDLFFLPAWCQWSVYYILGIRLRSFMGAKFWINLKKESM